MSRKSRFLVGITASVLTFGCLFATLGPEKFNQCGSQCHKMHQCCGHVEHEKQCAPTNCQKSETDTVK